MRLLTLVLSVSLLIGCATTQGEAASGKRRPIAPPTAVDRVETERLLAGVRASLVAQGEGLWLLWTGSATAPVNLETPRVEVSSIESVQRVRHAEQDPATRRLLAGVEAHLIGEYLVQQTDEAASRLVALESNAALEIDGEARPWQELEALLAMEADPEGRLAIREAALSVVPSLDAVHQEIHGELAAAATRLGFADRAEMAAFLRGMEKEEVGDLAEAILEQTEALHRDALGAAVQRDLGISLEEARRVDLPRVFRGIAFFSGFPQGGAMPALESTLESLGLSLAGVQIHSDDSPAKLNFPLCLAIAPGDVRLSIPAQPRDWKALFHQAGLAWAHAGGEAPQPQEISPGDRTAAAALGLLFENLLSDPEWLHSRIGFTQTEAQAFAAGEAVATLLQSRRQAGLLAVQLDEGGSDPAETYRRLLSRAYQLELSEEDAAWHRLDSDEYIDGAHFLRSRILAAMIEEQLIGSHGRRWWESREAGEELSSLKARMVGLRPEEIAKGLLGTPGGLDAGALGRRLGARLGSEAAPADG